MQYNASTDSVNLDGYDGRWTSNHQRHLCVFVTSRIDYCNSVLVGAPKALIDKLQRILNAAASDADKFDRGLTQLLHEKRHCLDVRDHVTFTLYDRAPQYRRSLGPTIQPEKSPFLVPIQHVLRPPGFCHCWSVRLEQSPGPCSQSELHRSSFQATAKGTFVCMALAHWGGASPWCAIQIDTLTLTTA